MTRLVPMLVLGLGLAGATGARADEPVTTSARPGDRAGYHGVELATPTTTAKRPAQEVKVVLETPHLKLATITLRDGTVLAEHSTPMPVTIQAMRGRGIVQIGGAREPISVDRMVVLAPGMKHAVIPDGKADLVLLVHHMKLAPGPGPGGGR